MSENKLRIVGDKPLWDEELRSWLEKYIQEHPHHSTEVLSRAQYIGIPRTVLEEYLEGIFFLPKKSGGKGNNCRKSIVEESIRSFREDIEGSFRHGNGKNFIKTRTWVQIHTACNTAIKENAIVVVYGKPGVGKSRCLLEFTRRNTITAPISVLCSRNITALYFIQRLALKLGLSEHAITARLEDKVAEKLMRYPRTLIIDQANYLGEQSLGTICYIWEVAHIPIVIAGTKSLYDKFTTSQLTEDVRAQLSSRVAIHYPLAELLLSEAKPIIYHALGEDTPDEIVAQIYNITGGIHRHLNMIFPRILELMKINAKELASGEVKLSELIARAGSRLMVG